MTDFQWVGEPDDRKFKAGPITHYALRGSAEMMLRRIQEIIDANPDLDPRDIRGSGHLMVAPGLTATEAERMENHDD